MKKNDVFAVILAGGQSSRLYPFNKVVSDLTGSGKSLIRQAFDRVSAVPRQNIYVLTVQDMVSPIRKQLKLPASHFFVDPARRGTWPALLWAMAHLRHLNPEAVMAVVTGDHVIPNVKEFRTAFQQAVETATTKPSFVVIPVAPSSNAQEWLGFGAVQAKPGRGAAALIEGFEEKPSLNRAGQMLAEGDWAWNAGMFFFRISVAEEVLALYQPDMYRIYQIMVEALRSKRKKIAAEAFETFPAQLGHPLDVRRKVDNTIDYAVMMPLVHRSHPMASAWVARQALHDWVDVGQWTMLRRLLKPDARKNVKVGRATADATTSDCILAADQGCTVEVHGLKGFVVAFSGGRALVLPEKEIPAIKDWVASAKAEGKAVVTTGMDERRIHIKGKRLVIQAKHSED